MKIFTFLLFTVVSGGKLTEQENADRLENCGKGNFSNFVTHRTGFGQPMVISPRHIVFSADRTHEWKKFLDTTNWADCKDRILRVDDMKVELSNHGMDLGVSLEVTYIGDCDPKKKTGIIVAEVQWFEPWGGVGPEKTDFTCLSEAPASKRTDVFVDDDLPEAIIKCRTDWLCLEEPKHPSNVPRKHFFSVQEKKDGRWSLVGVTNRIELETSKINFMSDFKKEICDVSGICPKGLKSSPVPTRAPKNGGNNGNNGQNDPKDNRNAPNAPPPLGPESVFSKQNNDSNESDGATNFQYFFALALMLFVHFYHFA